MSKWINRILHKHKYREIGRYLSWTGEDVVLMRCACGHEKWEYTLDTYYGRAKAPPYSEFLKKCQTERLGDSIGTKTGGSNYEGVV